MVNFPSLKYYNKLINNCILATKKLMDQKTCFMFFRVTYSWGWFMSVLCRILSYHLPIRSNI